MANWNDPQPTRQQTRAGFGASTGLGASVPRTGYDAGLRKYMLSIYNYMASAVLLSGVVALLMASSGMTVAMVGSPLMWLVMLSPLAIVFAMSFGANRFSTGTLQMLFWGFAILMGMSLSTIFLVYTGGSIAATFFATAGAFAGLSLFGYTTKKDLSGFGTFGKRGVGYSVEALISEISQILRTAGQHNIVLVGAGRLGQAIAEADVFADHGFSIVAIVDADPAKIGGTCGPLAVRDPDELPRIVEEEQVIVGVVAVPADAAQDVADELVRSGVRIVFNYSGALIDVPPDVTVHTTSPAVELLYALYFHLA